MKTKTTLSLQQFCITVFVMVIIHNDIIWPLTITQKRSQKNCMGKTGHD